MRVPKKRTRKDAIWFGMLAKDEGPILVELIEDDDLEPLTMHAMAVANHLIKTGRPCWVCRRRLPGRRQQKRLGAIPWLWGKQGGGIRITHGSDTGCVGVFMHEFGSEWFALGRPGVELDGEIGWVMPTEDDERTFAPR